MSDDLVKRLRDPSLGSPRWMDTMTEAAAEITRLRAELATARLQPTLNPDRWRGAINDALSGWMHPILDDEAPKDALQRLIRFEVMVNMDPETSEHVADLVHAARREGMEEAAKIAEECYRQNGPLSQRGFPERYRAGLAAGAQAIAAAIRAAAEEVKP